MTIDDVLDGVLEREGEGVPPYADPTDAGGRTRYGISERAHPEAWKSGPPTQEMARQIYAREYVAPFDGLRDVHIDERVRVALIDDAVLSGVKTSIRSLQRVLGVEVDGWIGPETITAAIQADGQWLLIRLVQARALRITRIVQNDPTQLKYLSGWITRSLGMLG
jgi:lysozyme family protein